MSYFCTKDELHGTDCHEFFAGDWDGSFWSDDSIYIYDEVFCDSGLRGLLRRNIPDYSPYDTTELYPDDWEKLRSAAAGCEDEDDESAKVLAEAEEWVQRAFEEHGSFTILGI